MNLQQVEKDDYKYIRDRVTDPDQVQEQIKSAMYIRNVCELSQIQFLNWDVVAMFGPGNGLFYTSTRDINGQMRSYESNPILDTSPCELLEPGQADELDKLAQERRRNIADTYNRIRQTSLSLGRKYESCMNEALLYLNAMREEQYKLNNAHKRVPDYRKQVLDVLNRGFFDYHGTFHQFITFVTKKDVYLQNHDLEVNLGKYLVTYNTATSSVRIRNEYEEFTLSYAGSIQHPHVRDESICWGDLIGLMRDAQNANDMDEILDLTRTLLCSYNRGDAYVQLHIYDKMLQGWSAPYRNDRDDLVIDDNLGCTYWVDDLTEYDVPDDDDDEEGEE